MKKVETICEKNGGLKQGQFSLIGNIVHARCKDGALFFPKEILSTR